MDKKAKVVGICRDRIFSCLIETSRRLGVLPSPVIPCFRSTVHCLPNPSLQIFRYRTNKNRAKSHVSLHNDRSCASPISKPHPCLSLRSQTSSGCPLLSDECLDLGVRGSRNRADFLGKTEVKVENAGERRLPEMEKTLDMHSVSLPSQGERLSG
jgi:hypothetical protein